MLKRLQSWLRQRKYREGAALSRFVAPDVRRDVVIVSTARLSEGIVTARTRTANVLYVHKGLVSQPEFESPRDIPIQQLWDWSGATWGGLPDGTSIADHLHQQYSAPWEALDADNNFHDELQRETPPEHVLFGATTRAIARRTDCDDFLFRVLDRNFMLAVVHLTWTNETDPAWPSAELFDNWDAFKANRHDPDAADWNQKGGTRSR